MTSDVKGYVVRVNFEGHEDWICRISGNLCPCVKEERTLFTLGDAIEASKMPKAPAVATILRVYADGREERLPSYEAALGEVERIRALFNAQTVDLGRANAEIERLRTQVSALMDRVERESRVVFDAERGRDEARAESARLQGLIGAFAKRARLRSDADGWCNLVAELAPFEALRQESVAAAPAEPLVALEAAEQRLLEAGGWKPGPRDRWMDPAGGNCSMADAVYAERRRIAAKKGGTQ